LTEVRVDGGLMRADFDALARIGATAEGGVDRPCFSEAHLAARAWFVARAREEGLAARVDAAGNHSAVLGGGARTMLLGSHLDSVPHGGRFDGALGVVAALHALIAMRSAGVRPRLAFEAIDFTDEEGTLVGLLGSGALAGTLTRAVLEAPRGGRAALLAGFERAGLREDALAQARREAGSLAAYLELHIEQGPVLERAGADIGVVTAIVGARSFMLRFHGEAGHAGTTPMGERRDAGLAAAAFALAANELVVRDFPGAVATVGELRLEPGVYNVIPGTAALALEFRAADARVLDELEQALLARARGEAATRRVELEVEAVGSWQPTALDAAVCDAIERAAARLGLRTLRLASGAGHDAQALAAVTAAGMIFVPSVGGRSHDHRELTPWQSCVGGANVLLTTALDLAGASASS
jgi:beta-ureidopropionase / N-carbamoyl-L-amino-acid hydrolase